MKNTAWWERFMKRRHQRNYADKVIDATRPEAHLRRPSRAQILSAARRFAKAGEISNAVEMIKLAHAPKQLTLRLIGREIS